MVRFILLLFFIVLVRFFFDGFGKVTTIIDTLLVDLLRRIAFLQALSGKKTVSFPSRLSRPFRPSRSYPHLWLETLHLHPCAASMTRAVANCRVCPRR
jgi:hypothetical protein